MSKRIDIQIGANTSSAQQSLDTLGKSADKIGVKIDRINGKNLTGKNAKNKADNTDLGDFMSELSVNTKELKRAIENLTKSIEKAPYSQPKNEKVSSTPPKQDKKTQKDTSTKEVPKKSSKDKKEDKDTSESLGRITAMLSAGRFAYGYMKGGASQSQALESESMRIFNRLESYGSDFNSARKGAYSVGSKYGYNNQESLYMQENLINSTGFIGKEELNSDTGSMMSMSRAYGLDSASLIDGYSALLKRGAFANGGADEYNDIVSASIGANKMQGREAEQLRALNIVTDTLTRGKLEVTSKDFKDAANLQANLAMVSPSLKGDKGAEVISRFNSTSNPEDDLMIRLAGYGSDLGYGLEGYAQARKIVEKGWGDPEARATFLKNKERLGINDTQFEILMSQKSGNTMLETEAYLKAIKNGDNEAIKEYEGKANREELYKKASSSKAMTQEKYSAEKENAQIGAGNVANSFSSIGKSIYNYQPGPIQGLLSMGLGMGASGFIGKLAGNAMGGLLGKGGKSAVDASIGASDEVVGAVAKGSKNLGKLGKIGKLGLGVGALAYGAEFVSDLNAGDKEGASGTLGAGLLGLGGSIAGAKLGAMAGTAIAPGVGTAAGALGGLVLGGIGSVIGRKSGEGLYNSFGEKKEDAKDKSVVERKEHILKKEEELVDRMLSGDFMADDSKAPEGSMRNLATDGNQKNNLGASYAQQRNEFAQAYASNGGDVAGALSASGINTQISGNSNREKVWNFFKNNGYSDAATAGIIGNLMQESSTNIDPTLHQKGGPGRGIAQWTNGSDRFKNLNALAKKKGTTWQDLQTQLEFIEQESRNGAAYFGKTKAGSLEGFKKMTNVEEAVVAWQEAYERAGKPMYANRKKYANQAYNEFKNTSSSARRQANKTPERAYAVGTDRVTHDQIAMVHKDEAILNKFEAKEFREGGFSSNTSSIELNVNITSDGNVEQKIYEAVMKGIAMVQSQMQKGQNGIQLNRSFTRNPV